MSVQEVTARFVTEVRGEEDELDLGLAAMLIAAHARPGLHVERELARLDQLAEDCPEHSLEGLRHQLFRELGLSGDHEDYANPDNSFLDQVLARRRGIPISLSVLTMEVGWRIGVPLEGVGMPGHFLLRHLDDPPVLLDPFNGGEVLDRAGCEQRFRETVGPGAAFDESFLAPVGPRGILARMLANLRATYVARGDTTSLAWVLRLRVAIPGVPAGELRHLAGALGALGRFDEAALALEALAASLPEAEAVAVNGEATGLRARLN